MCVFLRQINIKWIVQKNNVERKKWQEVKSNGDWICWIIYCRDVTKNNTAEFSDAICKNNFLSFDQSFD